MKKFFRKSLACIIAVMMIATSLPFSAITASADTVAGDKVLFAYFCGDDEGTTAINQKIRFAVSEDGINFSPLNGNLPILSNEEDGNGINFNGEWGKYIHTGGARDPFVFNKRNANGSIAPGYYIVATDLCVNKNSNSYNNTKILVWDVPSLDQLDSVQCTVIDTAGMYSTDVKDNTDAIAWAPEIVWDYDVQKYALVWSASLWSSAKIHVAYTSDFKTFTTRAGDRIDGVDNFAEVLYTREGYNFIDANINYENGKYYMVIKRENGGNGAKGVLYSVSAPTLDGLNAVEPIRFHDSVNTGEPNGLEGPEVYQRPDGRWVLIADEYVKNPVCSFVMYDLGTSLEEGLIGKGANYDHRNDLVTTNINSVKPRHGGIARISDADYNTLNSTYAGYNESSPGQLIAKYFTTSGDVTADATGNFYTLTNNGVTMTTKDGKVCAYFNNSGKSSNNASAQYAYLPLSYTTMAYALSAKKGVTFTWNAYDLGNSGDYEEYANMFNLSKYTGNPGTLAYDDVNWTHNQYKLSYLTSQLSSGISNGTQTSAGAQRMDVKIPALNAWHSYKVVYGLNGMQVYRDNSLVKSYALDGINDSWINDVFSNGRLVFGASLFGTDKLFNGYISDFRIYSTSNAQNISNINNPTPTTSKTDLHSNRYGLVTNGSETARLQANGSFQIVNDAQADNTNAGILHFDLQQFAKDEIGKVYFNVTLDSLTGDTQIKNMDFYYATSIKKDSTWLHKDGKETLNAGIGYGSGIEGVNKVLGNLGYNEAKEHGRLETFPMRKNDGSLVSELSASYDVSETIKGLITKGYKDLYIIIMHANAGGSNGTDGWSDALISPSKVFFTVNYTRFDNTTLVGNKTYIDKNIDNWKAPASDAVMAWDTDTGIQNALYSSNTYIDNSENEFSLNKKSDDTKLFARAMPAVGRIVYMYTDENSVAKIPIIVESRKNKPNDQVLQRYRFNYLITNSSDWTFNNSNWYKSPAQNPWDIDTKSNEDGYYVVSSDPNHNAVDYNESNRDKGNSATLDVHNIATYKGTVSFGENGYMKLSTPTIDMSLDGFCWWTERTWTGKVDKYSYQNNITKDSTDPAIKVPTLSLPSTASYYFLDCRDIMEKYPRVKREYESVKAKEDHCTEDSLLAYYQAVSNLVGFKLDGYDLSTDANLQQCASNMAKYISAYNTAYNNLNYNYVFKRKNGTFVATIPAKTYSTAYAATLANGYDPSPTTDKTSDGAGNHTWTTYAWPATVADGVYEIVEVATTHSEKCTNDGTDNCSVCGGSLLDKTALNAAIATAEPIYNSKNENGTYVTESFNEFKAVYDTVTTANPTTQDDVNSLTALLTTATNTLRKTTLTYKFDEKVGNTTTVKENSTASYGVVKEFKATGGDVEQWEIVTENGTDQPVTRTYIKTGENTISLVITRNVEVIAHLAENGTTQQNITKVVFLGRNNAVVAIKYIEPDDKFETRNVPIPAIPFYEENGWDKTEVVGLENGGEIIVRAKYTFNGQDADKCGIHYDGFEGKVRKYNYDSFVKLYNPSKYFGMYSEPVADVTSDEAKNKVLTYFKTDEFYAPHNSNIYVYALPKEFTPTATVGVTGSYRVSDDTNNVAAFNCKFFVPDDAKIVEWGIKANAGGKTYNFKSNNRTSRNEYTFKVTVANDANISSIRAKAYIIYMDKDGNRTTLLSNNEVTIDFN